MQIRKTERTGIAGNREPEIWRTAENKTREEEPGKIDEVESGLAEQEREGGNRNIEIKSSLVVGWK